MAFDPDAYLAEAPESESSIKSKFNPDSYVADTVDEHKIDPNFNPYAVALQAGEGTPEWEHARKVDEAREALPSSEKKKYGLEDSFGGKAVNAVKGAVQFGVGLAAAPALNAASVAANAPSIIKGTANALLGMNFDDTRSPVAQQLQTDAILAAEKAGQSVMPEEGSTPTKSYLISRTMDHPLTAQEIADLKAGKLKKEIEQLPNQSFKDRVEDFRRNSELSQGKVQDTGIFADVAKKTGFTPSEATLSPEQKKELGVEPDAVENYIIDAAGAVENPENAVYALAPEIPGIAGALKGTGKAISAVAAPLARAAEHLPEGSLHSMVAHPVRTALASTLRGGLKLAPKAGEFVESAGQMAAGGAPAEGASALGIRAKQALIGSVGGTAIGVVTDPEDPVQGALSGFVMGAGGGALHSAKGAQLAGKRAAMEEQGAALRTGNDAVDTRHDIIIGNFDPEAAKAINRQRAALAADGTHLVVTDQTGFNAAMQANGMPDANGVRGATLGDDKHIVTQGQDGSRTIYINADAVGEEKGFQGVDTAGHEIGHAVVDYLKAQSSQAAANTLVDAVANSLTDAEKADIADKYSKAINAQTAGASVNPTEETIAEITRKVLAKQDISEFGMPKTLGTKISNAISDFFTGARGDSAGMLWGTPEITKAKRLIQDALYDQGKRSTEMRQRARDVAEGKVEPNVTERQQQITARLSEISALDPKKVTPSILKERGKLLKEASDLTADEAARTGQPAPGATPAPAQPAAPAGPSANDRLTVKTALITMGYPARVADQMAAAAQGGTIEELIKDALAKKQPAPVPQTAPPAAPAPNVGPSGIPPAIIQPKPLAATPTGQLSTFEAPAATATAEAPAQLSTFDPNATNQVSAGVPPLSPGNADGGPTPTEPAGGSRPVSTPEEVGAAVGAATDAAKATPEYERALKKKEKAKAAGDAATEAQADARLETLEREARLDALKKLLPRHEEGSGTAPDELHIFADNFGNESVRGKVDENNPVHREIMAHGEMSPEEIARVKQLQDNAGAISYIDYGSAAKEDNARRHGEQRRAELAASPAQERVEGVGGITEQKNKAVIPVGNTVTASGRVNTVALSPDKILSNLGSVVRAATENGLPNGGFSGRPEALQNLSIYLRNHRNGFSGDGTVKVDPTIAPNATGESFVDAKGQPVDPETAKARMRVFNMAMHDTRATAPARAEAKRSAYEAAMKAWTDGGEQGPKPRKPRDLDPKSKFQAEEGQALAKRFGEMDEATGETNPLRADLEAAGYDASKELESPWENLRPELIRDIRDSADGKQEIVRPHRVDPEDIGGAVTNPPSGKAILAGFMPGEGGEKLSSIKSKVEEAAEKQGYTISAAHSTNAGPFTVFKTDNLSAHFGTPKAAEDRAQQLRDFSVNTVGREHADARVMPLFLKIEKPLKLPDLAGVTMTERGEIKPIDEAREEWLSKLSKEDRDAWENPDDYEGDIRDEIQQEYGYEPRPMAWESDTDFAEVLHDKGIISTDEFWDVQYDPQAAVELLKEKGYDGIEYVNDVEDPGSVSHIVFDPSQVKSAEDFTKDDTGADIPISKRFDASNPDIRFMPGGDKQGGDLSDFKPEDRTAEPSIKSKGALSNFMPGDFSGRNEVNVKDRSDDIDFSPEAMKKRRIGDFMAQKPWLDEQAQKLGYDDSDALNDADNSKFNELAEKWREDHPRYDSQGRMLFMPGEGQPGKYKNPELSKDAKPEEIAAHNAANEIKRVLFRAGLLDQGILDDLNAPGDIPSYRKPDIESALEAAGDRRSYDEILSGNQEDLESDPEHRVDFTEGDNANIFDWAVQAHGVTDEPQLAGYILPDGRMLDFSESRNGGGGSRSADHRQIQYPGREGEGYKAMRGFMEAGAVRMDANSGAIDIAKKPTPAQERLIRRVIEEAGQGYIDVTDGDRRASFEVDADAVGKVMGRIKRFYAGEDFESGAVFMPGTGKPIDGVEAAGADPKDKKAAMKAWQEKREESPWFKKWFGKSKVADDEGKPIKVFSGHSNIELYGTAYDPKKTTAGGFYATEDPAIASNYSIGKMGTREEYANGSQYRFEQKNGKFGKKIWQIELTPEQVEKARAWLKHGEDDGEGTGSGSGLGLDIERYWKEHAPFDATAKRAMYRGIKDLQSIHDTLDELGYNIAYADEPTEAREPLFMRQNKNHFEELLDHLGIKWQNYQWSQPGVQHLYLRIENPIDADKPFPPDLLAALDKASKRERNKPFAMDSTWTDEYPLKQWVQDIKDGNEYWSTHIPAKALPIIKQFGYDGIKERGNKTAKTREERQINWIAFDPDQIKSVYNQGTFDSDNPDMRMMPGEEPRRSWFVRGGKRVYHKRRGDGTFAPKQTLAKPPMGALTSANPDDNKQLADFK